ncbi:MAG: hypothetical protein HY075_14400 [Deltaproteobacteria bacterium]|nr:hypothetical protein [Deltaproteobacteria bacterium]
MIKADEVFNANDFESIRLHIYFSNTTTRTEIRDPKKNELVEIGDKWLVFELPSKCCAKQHSVLIEITRSSKKSERGPKDKPDKEIDLLSVTGKVHHVQDLGEDRWRVTIECVQFDETEWTSLLNMYSSRQAEIEQFFAAVKG